MTATSVLDEIDWQRPWLAPWAALGQAVAAQVRQGAHVHEALNAQPALAHTGIRFVPQTELPAGMAYEQFIFQARCVPTRENLHDFFNGLAWLKFPQIKNKLNALQAEQIAQHGVQSLRGPVRDALTLVDENSAFLLAPQPLCHALQAMDWPQLFGPLRGQWQSAQLVIFGHALLEKLTQPRKPMVAHVLCTWPDVSPQLGDALDPTLTNWLSAQRLAHKPFAPLPVLGVPGWWPGNDDPAFYGDRSVFRAPRAASGGRNTRKSAVSMLAGP
jgi:Protein of unknown function (DUF3025)